MEAAGSAPGGDAVLSAQPTPEKTGHTAVIGAAGVQCTRAEHPSAQHVASTDGATAGDGAEAVAADRADALTQKLVDALIGDKQWIKEAHARRRLGPLELPGNHRAVGEICAALAGCLFSYQVSWLLARSAFSCLACASCTLGVFVPRLSLNALLARSAFSWRPSRVENEHS